MKYPYRPGEGPPLTAIDVCMEGFSSVGSIGYYDKEGRKLWFSEYSELHADDSYRTVNYTSLTKNGRTCRVSTVWLGLDHNHSYLSDDHVPIIFETMIFGGDKGMEDEYQERYATEAAALRGHEVAVQWAIDNYFDGDF